MLNFGTASLLDGACVYTVPVLVQGWILVLTVVFSGVDTGTVFGQCCGAGPFFLQNSVCFAGSGSCLLKSKRSTYF